MARECLTVGHKVSFKMNVILALTLVFLSVTCVSGLYREGLLRTTEDWHFLARFCFVSEFGRLRYEVEYPKSFEVENILLYYDEPGQWPAVYPPDDSEKKTCLEKESVMRPENNQIINLTDSYVWSGCVSTRIEEENSPISVYGDDFKFSCKGGRSFRSVRERWWYLALSNCGSSNGLYMKYKLTLTNGDSWWKKHFSADQFGILQTDILFLCLFTVSFFGSLYVADRLKDKQLFHTTYKMFIAVQFCYVFSLLFYVIFYIEFANDGTEATNLKWAARILQSIGDGVFLLMLILMGKGYTITRGRISHSGTVKIAVLMCVYIVLYAGLFFYESSQFDPGEVLYLYESPAGFALIGLRGFCWFWFIYAIFFTLKHYPEKGSFYYPFFFMYSVWFIALPIMILVATFGMPKWWREKIMNIIELCIAYLGQVIFLILTRPSAANSNFPYHVRTSQIGVLTTPSDGNSNNVDNFMHHSYGANPLGHDQYRPNFTEMFTVESSNPYSSTTYSNGVQNGNTQKMNGFGETIY
ncbi:transmembrane protein 145-like [Anneissia japonica]|uniref:transmembrane protein 145-like n=1 Tax=Anneissia japonica TaxID=1529436 RepID=UPI001425658D|nr:transmembrane protein 145-like [Anneissia japonica]